MFFPSFMRDANTTALSLMEASMENARNAQQAMMKQAELASRTEMPWQMKWTGGTVPMPVMKFKANQADSTREAFHMMADANMKKWEKVAKTYAAMPGWMKLPYTAPGEFWAKWFDQWQEGKFDTFTPESVNAVVETMTTAVNKASTTKQSTSNIKEATAKAAANLASAKATATAATEVIAEIADTGADHKPELLTAPKGDADILTSIKGIGPKLSQTLNDFGIYHFDQIASWTPENISWLDEALSFKGRIQREGWVDQAIELLKSK